MVYKDINLLPYEILLERERREKRIRLIILISFFLIIAVSFMLKPILDYKLLYLPEEESLIKQLADEEKLDSIEKEIKTLKDELDIRYGFLNYINQDRIELLDVFVNLEEKLPSEVFLTNFNVTGDEVSMGVVAKDIQAVSDFIFILKQESKYDQINTNQITKEFNDDGEIAIVKFNITFVLVKEIEEGN